jgi:glucosylceramidase
VAAVGGKPTEPSSTPPSPATPLSECSDNCIVVDETVEYQAFYGMGASLTESSAEILRNHSDGTNDAMLRALFDTQTGIGLSILRQPMGTSDFRVGQDYTYQDDPGVFSIERDLNTIVPAILNVQAIQPNLKVMAVPWSPPAYMKTPPSLYGGSLQDTAFDDLSLYFKNYVEAYEAAGISIWAVSVQNEPQHESSDYPTMAMSASEHAMLTDRVNDTLTAAGYAHIKVVAYEHNWDTTGYVQELISHPDASMDAVSFHCYAGSPDAQTVVTNHEIFFTECTEFGDPFFEGDFRWAVRNLVIDAVRYGASTVLQWNLILQDNGPKMPGGCENCRGLLNVDAAGGYIPSPAYYAYGHLSKFVLEGAVRIDSTETPWIKSVAIKNPNGSAAVVLLNDRRRPEVVNIQLFGMVCLGLTMPAFSAATVVYDGTSNTVDVWATHAKCCDYSTLLYLTQTIVCS